MKMPELCEVQEKMKIGQINSNTQFKEMVRNSILQQASLGSNRIDFSSNIQDYESQYKGLKQQTMDEIVEELQMLKYTVQVNDQWISVFW